MNLSTLLLCVLVNGAKSNDIFPARILAQQKTLRENSDLHVTCSTFGFKKNISVFVYLCNNGIWVAKQTQKLEETDTVFKVPKVTPKHSGNYSCVYSQNDNLPPEMKGRGNNIIEILVIANFYPADLSLSGPSTVNQGEQVEFLCSLQNVLQTLGECDLIQSYLMQDGLINQVGGFDLKLMKAKFVVQEAMQRDSGNYTCVVLPSQCFKENEERLTGKNAILQVKENFPLELTLCLTMVAVAILGVYLWTIYRNDMSTSCLKHPQTNTDNTVEQQRRTEERAREELTLDEQVDSFDNEEEVNYGYQNVGRDWTTTTQQDGDQAYTCDHSPVYDEVLDFEGPSNRNPSEPVYTAHSKNK